VDDLTAAPAFFDFVYRLVADFEGHQEAEVDGRYLLLPHRWASSFGEMYHAIGGRAVQDLCAVQDGTAVMLSDGFVLRFSPAHVQFGSDPLIDLHRPVLVPECRKNIEMEPCTLDFVKSIAVGKQITSAGDFGSYLEVGLDHRFNLGLHAAAFHLISTENPIEDHRL
jgi:hypothetical protein